jgi:hypothetical protein
MSLASLACEAAGKQAISLVTPLATGEELTQEFEVGACLGWPGWAQEAGTRLRLHEHIGWCRVWLTVLALL